ncbi:MAG: hypothetical protein QM650_11755 [Microlunatus sp.]
MMDSIVTPPFNSAKALSREGETRRASTRRSRKPGRTQVDDKTKALRGMLAVRTFTY